MKISKKEAVRKHRMMWNWIADQYECGHGTSVNILKRRFIKRYYPGDNPYSICYCCEYSTEISGIDGKSLKCNCERCPLEWPSDSDYHHDCMCCYKSRNHTEVIHDGLYKQILYYSSMDVMDYEKATIIAREIANLPERKIEEE